jgi:undecaprenyl diphosphate synthase
MAHKGQRDHDARISGHPHLDTTGGAPAALPRVAIISDGSARWARAHGRSIEEGHEAAADTVLARIEDAIELGIEQLTLYAFSTENWGRPLGEVQDLLAMLAHRITADCPTLHRQGVRVRFIGRRDRTGEALGTAMHNAEQMTARNERIAVFVAFDYGGRDEIVAAAERYQGGGEREFAELITSAGPGDPDLVIRTSGEHRLSNFLLWQAAYAELVFRDELWPDFDREVFKACLCEYARRSRRYGTRAVIAEAGPRSMHKMTPARASTLAGSNSSH